MKEIVGVQINGELVKMGYSSMMAPTTLRETNRVFKMMRLVTREPEHEGDIFFFEFRCSKNGKEEWILLPEFGFINLDGPEELQEVYEKIQHLAQTTWDEFVDMLFLGYYWVD